MIFICHDTLIRQLDPIGPMTGPKKKFKSCLSLLGMGTHYSLLDFRLDFYLVLYALGLSCAPCFVPYI